MMRAIDLQRWPYETPVFTPKRQASHRQERREGLPTPEVDPTDRCEALALYHPYRPEALELGRERQRHRP